ncbi:type IV secretory system conjugative DNA transfer family protein [Microvirga splendida]|uniref:Type IV secretory system conjugative DNA transfer family protein n=1 Tax=Microvirga splendida TaxID=2795727 RepID=A0ABS0Y3N0_9HYPH|nr:type IV secretory system conjugative DNA transfer family protein [Microvirga splendida]MBJ6126902.1 type IV secretory system conjugative DNA transfer family protein [Microvirga splendida]
MGRILYDLTKALLRYCWPLLVFWLWLFIFEALLAPLLPASMLPAIRIATPLLLLGVTILINHKPLIAWCSLLSFYYGADALLTIWGAAATASAQGYSTWAILSAPGWAGPTFLALLSIVGSATGLAKVWAPIRSLFAGLSGLKGMSSGFAREQPPVRNDLNVQRVDSDLYGNANWISHDRIFDKVAVPHPGEVARPNRIESGIIVGQSGADSSSPLVIMPLEAHLITIAPTRTGKGAGSIITNLLSPAFEGHTHGQKAQYSWRGPVVIIDPKNQAFFVTADRREQLGRRVVLLDPYETALNPKPGDKSIRRQASDTYNPLDFVRRDEHQVADVKALIAALIIPPPGTKDPFWVNSARLLVGALVHWVIRTEPHERSHLGTVFDLFNKPREILNETLDEMIQVGQDNGATAADKACAAGAKAIREAPDQTQGSIYATVSEALFWLATPHLRRQIETSSFELEALSRNEIDIFVAVPPNNIVDCAPWLRIWTTLPMRLTARPGLLPEERVLLVVDEAPLLGRLDAIRDAFRVSAGYRISVWLIGQTYHGLKDAYGEDVLEDMIGNAEFVQFFEVSPNDDKTADRLSKMLGHITVKKETKNTNTGNSARMTDVFSNLSEGMGSSEQLEKRALMTPDDIRALPSDVVIINSRSPGLKGPIRTFQSRYFLRPDTKPLLGVDPFRGD